MRSRTRDGVDRQKTGDEELDATQIITETTATLVGRADVERHIMRADTIVKQATAKEITHEDVEMVRRFGAAFLTVVFELPLSDVTVVDGERAVLECRIATPRRRRGRVVRQQRRDRFRDRQRVAAVECAVQRRRFADCTLRRPARPVGGSRPSHGRRGHVVHRPAAARRHAVKGDAAVDKSKDE